MIAVAAKFWRIFRFPLRHNPGEVYRDVGMGSQREARTCPLCEVLFSASLSCLPSTRNCCWTSAVLCGLRGCFRNSSQVWDGIVQFCSGWHTHAHKHRPWLPPRKCCCTLKCGCCCTGNMVATMYNKLVGRGDTCTGADSMAETHKQQMYRT